jgi:hypothetical protein
VENRTFAIGHKDRHFLESLRFRGTTKLSPDPQQQAMAQTFAPGSTGCWPPGDITARQLAKRAAGNDS